MSVWKTGWKSDAQRARWVAAFWILCGLAVAGAIAAAVLRAMGL